MHRQINGKLVIECGAEDDATLAVTATYQKSGSSERNIICRFLFMIMIRLVLLNVFGQCFTFDYLMPFVTIKWWHTNRLKGMKSGSILSTSLL